MNAPLENIVVVDEVRPSSFDGHSIPVTKDEFDFFQKYIPFSLTHTYENTFTHNVNLAMLLFHRAIKLETSFAARTDKEKYLEYELEKNVPLLRPFSMQVQKYDAATTTLFGLKYVLSEAIDSIATTLPSLPVERLPDYYARIHELKNFPKVNTALSAFDNSAFASQAVFVFGSATNIKHNSLKKSFSDIDTHLVTPIDSFQTYVDILSFVTAQQKKSVPLSVNIIPEEHAYAYFLADPNYMSSPESSLLRGSAVHYTGIPAVLLEQKMRAALAQNVLRTKNALLDDGFRFWDSSLPAFNAKGKKSNLVFAYAQELQRNIFPFYKPFVSREYLPAVDEARDILVNQSIQASRILKRFLLYQK